MKAYAFYNTATRNEIRRGVDFAGRRYTMWTGSKYYVWDNRSQMWVWITYPNPASGKGVKIDDLPQIMIDALTAGLNHIILD